MVEEARVRLEDDERLLRDGLRRRFFADAQVATPSATAVEGALRLAAGSMTLTLFAEGVRDADIPQPERVAQAAAAFKRAALARNTAMLAQAGPIAEALAADDIAAVFFKGPLQQRQLYGDHFVRPSGDLDLLVPRPQFEGALRALRSMSYAPRARRTLWWDVFLGEVHLTAPDAVGSIDMHHGLQQPGLPRPRAIPAFFERPVRVQFGKTDLPAVPPGLVPLVVAMNLVKSLFHRKPAAAHACDLMAALGNGEPNRVRGFRARAEEQGLGATADLALRALEAVFAADLRVAGPVPLSDWPDAAVARLVLAPERAPRIPRRREISAAACAGRTRALGVGLWYLCSEASRRGLQGNRA